MLRELLRRETQAHHERIERYLAFQDSVKTKTDYIVLLERFYGFYLPVEMKLNTHHKEFSLLELELKPRLKTVKLRSDLRALGGEEAKINTLPLCKKIPKITNFSQALGCLYVLEGSTLGAQMLVPYFQKVLAPSTESGLEFFSGYRAETGSMWRQFFTFLNAYKADQQNTSDIIEAACATFECLGQWLRPEHD